MWVYGQCDPTAFRIELMQANRSWSFLTKSRIQQVYGRNSPDAFVETLIDLVCHINTVPQHTPITKVWNKDLTQLVSTRDAQDDRHHVVGPG